MSRGGQSITVPRWQGKGVACRWSFVPTAECYLRTLLLVAPTSGGTWDSLSLAEVADCSIRRLPRNSKSTSESVRRHSLQKWWLNSQPPRTKLVRNSWRHPTSVTPSLPYGGARVPRHFCLFQPRTGRQDLHARQSRRQSLHGQQLVTLEMSILSIFPFYDSC